MDAIEREFLAFWLREREADQMSQAGRMLGVLFKAGEVRAWKKEGTGDSGYDDEDDVLVPLSFMIRPEGREGLQKLVGSSGLSLPTGYRKQNGEIIVDLGKVTPEEFQAFVAKNRVNTLKRG